MNKPTISKTFFQNFSERNLALPLSTKIFSKQKGYPITGSLFVN